MSAAPPQVNISTSPPLPSSIECVSKHNSHLVTRLSTVKAGSTTPSTRSWPSHTTSDVRSPFPIPPSLSFIDLNPYSVATSLCIYLSSHKTLEPSTPSRCTTRTLSTNQGVLVVRLSLPILARIYDPRALIYKLQYQDRHYETGLLAQWQGA